MLSIRYNTRIRSRKSGETSWKNKKIKPFINKYNLEEINDPSAKDVGKKLSEIALNV